MRINIKTRHPVKDRDIRVLYIVNAALSMLANKRMVRATLDFFADREGWKIVDK